MALYVSVDRDQGIDALFVVGVAIVYLVSKIGYQVSKFNAGRVIRTTMLAFEAASEIVSKLS